MINRHITRNPRADRCCDIPISQVKDETAESIGIEPDCVEPVDD
jgi:hypothetical protein